MSDPAESPSTIPCSRERRSHRPAALFGHRSCRQRSPARPLSDRRCPLSHKGRLPTYKRFPSPSDPQFAKPHIRSATWLSVSGSSLSITAPRLPTNHATPTRNRPSPSRADTAPATSVPTVLIFDEITAGSCSRSVPHCCALVAAVPGLCRSSSRTDASCHIHCGVLQAHRRLCEPTFAVPEKPLLPLPANPECILELEGGPNLPAHHTPTLTTLLPVCSSSPWVVYLSPGRQTGVANGLELTESVHRL